MADDVAALKKKTADIYEAWMQERQQAEIARNEPTTTFRWRVPMPNDAQQTTPSRIDLPGGWYLVRDDEVGSPHQSEWFLSDPEDIWVAKFWDGPQAGEDDCRAFASALGVTKNAE